MKEAANKTSKSKMLEDKLNHLVQALSNAEDQTTYADRKVLTDTALRDEIQLLAAQMVVSDAESKDKLCEIVNIITENNTAHKTGSHLGTLAQKIQELAKKP